MENFLEPRVEKVKMENSFKPKGTAPYNTQEVEDGGLI